MEKTMIFFKRLFEETIPFNYFSVIMLLLIVIVLLFIAIFVKIQDGKKENF